MFTSQAQYDAFVERLVHHGVEAFMAAQDVGNAGDQGAEATALETEMDYEHAAIKAALTNSRNADAPLYERDAIAGALASVRTADAVIAYSLGGGVGVPEHVLAARRLLARPGDRGKEAAAEMIVGFAYDCLRRDVGRLRDRILRPDDGRVETIEEAERRIAGVLYPKG